MNTRTTLRLAAAAFFILHSSFFISRAAAQQATQPPAARLSTTGTTAPAMAASGTAASDDEVVQMSVFNVSGERDEGYQAADTTAGSRVRTALKDTPAAISPFSQEFLQDIGANTIEDMLNYAGNVEADTSDLTQGMNDASARDANTLDNSFRIRGMPMNVALDNVTTSYSMDTYNIDRAEVSSGPNSVLFGMGQAGGMVTLTSKRANLQRNKLSLSNVIGTWTSPAVSGIPFYRATVDYNLVLMPKTLGVRLSGVYQDGGNNSWRKWSILHDKRINPVVTWRPWRNTTINIGYETGLRQDSTTINKNLTDGVSAWLLLPENQRVMKGFGTSFALPSVYSPYANAANHMIAPTSQINSGNNNPYTVMDIGTGLVYNYLKAYQSQNMYGAGTTTNIGLPASMSSYYYNPAGPGALREQRFDGYRLSIEQRIGNLNLELGYYHNKNKIGAHSPGNGASPDEQLQADPNLFVSSPEWNGTGTPDTPAPHPGALYVEDFWFYATSSQRNDVARLTAEYSLDLGKYGRHRIIAFYEHNENEQGYARRRECLVDETGAGYGTPANPTNDCPYRRQYVTPGDFSTYYAGDWRIPLGPLRIGNHFYHSQYVVNGRNVSFAKRSIDSPMLVLQDYLFKDRLVTTFGARYDFIDVRQQNLEQVTNPNDPRVTSFQNALNEFALANSWNTRSRMTYTYSAGAVWHIIPRLSAFANGSTNRGAPTLNNIYVLPTGGAPAPSKGTTFDYGVMFDMLANGKIFLRLAHFETKLLNNLANNPDGSGSDTSTTLGGDKLCNIFDALYYLRTTTRTGLSPTNSPTDGWPSFTNPETGLPVQTGPDKGPMPRPQFAVADHIDSGAYPGGGPPFYNWLMTNEQSQGYEAELTANFTKNFTARFTFSYTQRNRMDVMKEILDYYNTNIPKWLAIADPNQNGGNSYWVNVPGPGSVGSGVFPLYEFIQNQLYGTPLYDSNGSLINAAGKAIANSDTNNRSIQKGLSDQLINQSLVMAQRPIKINLSARYQFTKDRFGGLLKGLAIGGSVRYQARNLMPVYNLGQLAPAPDDNTALGLDPDSFRNNARVIKGNSLTFWDAFATYKCKLFGGRTDMRLQFNIYNIFNQCLVTVARTNAYDGLQRIYLNAPRALRLTATFDF